MTSSVPPFSGVPPLGAKGRRRGATIDLTATEVESGPVAASDPAARPADPQPADPPLQAEPAHAAQAVPPDQAGPPKGSHEDRMGTNAERDPREAEARDRPSSQPGLRSRMPLTVPWPLLGAAAAGGLVVFAAFMIAGFGSGRDAAVDTLDVRIARVEQALRELAARPASSGADPRVIADLTGRLARLEAAAAAPRPQAADPALANRMSINEGELKALGETVAILGRRSDEIAATAREARQRADATAAALAELTKKFAQTAPAIQRSEFDALAGRLAAIERSEKAVEAELAKRPAGGSSDRSVRLAVAASVLQGALERGGPYADELATVQSLAPDRKALAPLEPFAASGLPAAASLARELAALTPALYQAAGAAPRDRGFLEKLQASAEKLVRIRPSEEVPGTDPAAIVARIEVKAAHADLAGALAELAKLPAEARAPALAWIKTAETRQAAIEFEPAAYRRRARGAAELRRSQ